jgi:hypothetical protein
MESNHVSVGQRAPRDPRYEDRIERLDRLFYIRWTSGPNYERAFICIEDGEPDMNDIAEVSFKRAEMFAAAYRVGKKLPLLRL